MSAQPRPAVVLCVSGHDPGGGAGVQADIESCAAAGVHAATVISCLTVQDTADVRRVVATAPILLAAQIEAVTSDCMVGAVKIGLLGDAGQLAPLIAALRELACPVVLDPVLRAGGGTSLVAAALRAAMTEQLFPLVSVLTPNLAEARLLASLPGGSPAECARRLAAMGCANVLVTSGDEEGPEVVNHWLAADGWSRDFHWPRIAQRFHGAGCTLASALAARLARGEPLAQAVESAQRYTQDALARSESIGLGRRVPRRFP